MAGASDQRVYQSLPPVEIVSDQAIAMRHAEQQVFDPRPSWKWWCQDGPVDNCWWCFPLRTGIMLLSLANLLDGVMMFFVDRIFAPRIYRLEREYDLICSRRNDTELCQTLLEKKAEDEFIVSCEPLLYLTGFVLICFSLVGMRAACTGNPKLAKLFMMVYPFLLVHTTVLTIMRTVMAPSTFTSVVILALCVKVFFCAYYFKVTWSFYYRRKVMEDTQLATDASVQGQTINLPVTRVPTVV